MMQVTGSSNTNSTTSRLSIRIPSGQSLHSEVASWSRKADSTVAPHPKADTLATNDNSMQILPEGVATVEITLCGPVVATLPREMAESLEWDEILSSVGLSPSEDEVAVRLDCEGAVALIARLSQEDYSLMEEWRRGGVKVALRSPLEEVMLAAVVATRRKKNVVLLIEEGCCYAAYAEEHKLHFAEALPLAGEEQLINLLALLNKDYDLRKAQFTLCGSDGNGYYKLVKNYFRRVKVAKEKKK